MISLAAPDNLGGKLDDGFTGKKHGDRGDNACCGKGPCTNGVHGILGEIGAFLFRALECAARESSSGSVVPEADAQSKAASTDFVRPRSARQ